MSRNCDWRILIHFLSALKYDIFLYMIIFLTTALKKTANLVLKLLVRILLKGPVMIVIYKIPISSIVIAFETSLFSTNSLAKLLTAKSNIVLLWLHLSEWLNCHKTEHLTMKSCELHRLNTTQCLSLLIFIKNIKKKKRGGAKKWSERETSFFFLTWPCLKVAHDTFNLLVSH